MSTEPQSSFEPLEEELEHPFVMVPMAIIRNPDISPEGKWFLSYLLSHTKKWRISVPYIIKSQKISKNRIYPIINECMEAGYLKRETYLENGMKKYRYFVSREPKFKKSLLCPQNQDTENQDTENEDRRIEQSSSNEEVKKNKIKRGKPLEPPSADAEALCDFFLSKIKERRPQFKEPNRDKWIKEFDCLLRIDKRDLMETKALIMWASEHSWWKTACISPAKLRKDFDSMALQMNGESEKELVRANRLFAVGMKESHPKEMKCMTFDSKYAIHSAMGKEVPFNLPSETFREALISMFGGQYVRE